MLKNLSIGKIFQIASIIALLLVDDNVLNSNGINQHQQAFFRPKCGRNDCMPVGVI